MGKKGSSKVFLPIFINVSKAEDSLKSVVVSPQASTVMIEFFAALHYLGIEAWEVHTRFINILLVLNTEHKW